MSYRELSGLTADGVLYENQKQGIIEALIPSGVYRSAHAPALLELPNGDLLCAWFAGSYEGNADVSIVCARLSKDAEKWDAPVKVSGDPTRSEQNPSLFLGPDGAVWVLYTAQLDRVEGKETMQYTAVIRRQKSWDGGRTWEPYETLFDREGSFCRQPIQVLADGRWIFGNWLCADENNGLASDPTVFQISDDKGASWRMVEMPDSRGRVHANVVELSPGHLAAFLRSRMADFVYRSDSFDRGEHWSAPQPTVLPNNNASISVIRLTSGRLAIAYNPTSAPGDVPGKAVWPGLRCPVAVALSEDDGETWPYIRVMEFGEGFVGSANRGQNRQYEYPCLLQSRDGILHLAYACENRRCIKYLRFREEDLMGLQA